MDKIKPKVTEYLEVELPELSVSLTVFATFRTLRTS